MHIERALILVWGRVCVCVTPPAAPNLIAVPFFFTVIIIILNISDPGAREEGHRLCLV